jgi:hypothetical protein
MNKNISKSEFLPTPTEILVLPITGDMQDTDWLDILLLLLLMMIMMMFT